MAPTRHFLPLPGAFLSPTRSQQIRNQRHANIRHCYSDDLLSVQIHAAVIQNRDGAPDFVGRSGRMLPDAAAVLRGWPLLGPESFGVAARPRPRF